MFDRESLRYTRKDIRKKADQYRKKHWSSNSIPIDIELIIEKIGFIPIPVPGIKRDCDTVACLAPDLKTIYIDQETFQDPKQAFYLRFSLGHELGHFVLHQKFFEFIKNKHFKTIQDWIIFIKSCDQDFFPDYFEASAEEFSGRFLVPREHLEEEIGKVLKGNKTQFDSHDPVIAARHLSLILHRKFEVNVPVINIRLKLEGLYPFNMKRKSIKRFSDI